MGKHIISKINGIFSEIIEKIKDLYNISLLPIWVEPSGRMTKEQEAELMEVVREDRKKTKQRRKQEKMQIKQQRKLARQNAKQQKRQAIQKGSKK